MGGRVPAKPDVKVTATSSTSLSVAWDPGSHQDTFRVLVTTTTQKDPPRILKCVRLTDAPDSCQLTGLMPQTQYNVTVRACRREGKCGPPFTVLTNTPESLGVSPFTLFMLFFIFFLVIVCAVANFDVLKELFKMPARGRRTSFRSFSEGLRKRWMTRNRQHQDTIPQVVLQDQPSSCDNPCLVLDTVDEVASDPRPPPSDPRPPPSEPHPPPSDPRPLPSDPRPLPSDSHRPPSNPRLPPSEPGPPPSDPRPLPSDPRPLPSNSPRSPSDSHRPTSAPPPPPSQPMMLPKCGPGHRTGSLQVEVHHTPATETTRPFT